MAYMGRGERPSIGQDNDNVYIHSHRYRRSYYHIISYSTYMKIEMIVTFIILIVGIIAFITTYQSAVIDPIENIKKQFINTHLILIGALLAITLITNFISKTEATLIKRLVIIAIISIITMITFLGIKLNLDITYTKEKFEQLYTGEISKDKTIDIGITGIRIKTEKEYFIDKSIEAYNIFKIRTYGTIRNTSLT